jgi:hypothetical protein
LGAANSRRENNDYCSHPRPHRAAIPDTDLARQLLSELSERAGQFYPFVMTGAGALPFPIGALPIQPASPAERATQHSTHISFFISNLLKDFD